MSAGPTLLDADAFAHRAALAVRAREFVQTIADIDDEPGRDDLGERLRRTAATEAAPGLASRWLLRAVARHAARLLECVSFTPSGDVDDHMEGGILRLDARLADYLGGLGERGREVAAAVRRKARERAELGSSDSELFALWEPGSMRWVTLLMRALWTDEVRQQIERAERLGTAAPALPFAMDMSRMRRARLVDGRIVDDHGASVLVPLGPDRLDALAERGLSALDSPIADRLFGWLLRIGFELHVTQGLVNMYSRLIEGGYSTIADELGMGGNHKARGEIEALLAALGACHLGWNTGLRKGWPLPLVHIEQHVRAAPGRPERFLLGLSPLWTPSLCHVLTGADRLLVPWLDLPSLDGLHTRHQRPAVLMWRALRLVLRQQADKIEHGAPVDWRALARDASFPEERLDELVRMWTCEQGPLEVCPGGGVTVRDPAVRTLLIEGAKRQESQRQRGKRSADQRKKRDEHKPDGEKKP